jgi:hypothetical protein
MAPQHPGDDGPGILLSSHAFTKNEFLTVQNDFVCFFVIGFFRENDLNG